jgi:transcriptional regulator of acetoin/glycerol metabolism
MPQGPRKVGRDQTTESGGAIVQLRPEIAASWHRSELNGVPRDPFPDVPIDDDFAQPTAHLLRAAAPVLDRLYQEISDASMSVMLTDPAARILDRRVGMRSLSAYLDDVVAVPGARYGEDIVGTNGLGTAVESRKPVIVDGPEHYAERLRGLTCAGSPVFHPVTGRLEGILDITARHEDANRLMLPMVAEATRDIQRRLYEAVSVGERSLFEEFVVAARRTKLPLLGLHGSFVVANSSASSVLDAETQALLREEALRISRSGRQSGIFRLPDGERYRIEIRPVTDGGELFGMLVRLRPLGGGASYTSVAALPGLVGRSELWRQLCADAHRAAASRLPVAIIGEPGTGKLAIARAVHHLATTQMSTEQFPGHFTVFDAAEVVLEPGRWFAHLRRMLHEPGTVVIRHAEHLRATQAEAVIAFLHEGTGRLIVTAAECWLAESPRRVLDAFPWRLEVPALRYRPEDIPILANYLAAHHGRPDLLRRVAAPALQALVHSDWPGNVKELETVILQLVQYRGATPLGLEHLPPRVQHRPRRHLTTIEQVEREAITEALQRAHGNKSTAAQYLGISRSTLYRKMTAYDIPEG